MGLDTVPPALALGDLDLTEPLKGTMGSLSPARTSTNLIARSTTTAILMRFETAISLVSTTLTASNQINGNPAFHNDWQYKVAVAFMLGHDYGFKRIMSSYY